MQKEAKQIDLIARDASLYVWLLTVTRPRRQAQPLPDAMRKDLGFPPRPPLCPWASAHARDR